MGRFPQPRGTKGSLRWVQSVVNYCPEPLNRELRQRVGLPSNEPITWYSPRRADAFAEYRDQAFLDLLGLDLAKRALPAFWPTRGPQWDALGKSRSGSIFLVEGKAHVTELLSPGTRASARSNGIIAAALSDVRSYIGAPSTVDWTQVFYQYANRLAHLYLLRKLNSVPAYLVFLYFVGDPDVDGPRTVDEWKSALVVAKGVLGLPKTHRLSKYVLECFLHVSRLARDTV